MKAILKRIYESMTRPNNNDPRSCSGGVHAKLEVIHTDSYGKMMFYCKQCGQAVHY